MKLRSITLNNVRRFTTPARIAEIGDGLNLLCEPNEHGKSTLFDAIHALFFSPYRSGKSEVKSLQPHAGGAPEVTISVETEEGLFEVSKRWLSKPSAIVKQGNRLIAQADEAEAWISKLLGGSDGGPSGLVWVRQGVSGLRGESKKEQDASLEARRDLLSSVSGEVEAMTGGRRMDKAIARCRQELESYATSTGRPRSGGPWKLAIDRVEELTAHCNELAETASELHQALDQRKRQRRALAELEDPEKVAERKSRLDVAEKAHRIAERHAEDVEAASQKLATAELARGSAQARLDALQSAIDERRSAEKEMNSARSEAEVAISEHAKAKKAHEETSRGFQDAQAARQAAEKVRQHAQRRQAGRDGAARRNDLANRIRSAEQARKRIEEQSANANRGPDAEAMRKLETLESQHLSAVAARNAAATQIEMTYGAGRKDGVQLDGVALPGGHATPIPRSVKLAIEGIGELEITPATGKDDDASVEATQERFRKELERYGATDLDTVRGFADARAEAERLMGEARAALNSLAPDGIDALREVLASIPMVEDEEEEGPDLLVAETALSEAEDRCVSAQARRDAAAERFAIARSRVASSEATLKNQTDRLGRANAAEQRLGEGNEEALKIKLESASKAFSAAEALYAEKKKWAPDLSVAAAGLKRARAVDEEARSEIARLKPDIARLDERISRSSGEAVEERLSEVRQELESAQAGLSRIEKEVAVLQRLGAALNEARDQSRERYFSPVAAELKPLFELLWPDAVLTWDQDDLVPHSLTRDGQEESIEILSGGTQEQVALLVRLAFARMLARGGRHAPVILDDALVFTDDDRIERVFDALHRQANELQILVLTCRQRAFRDLGAHTLHLRALTVAEDAA